MAAPTSMISDVLASVCRHMGADVAYLIEYGVGGAKVREVAGSGDRLGLAVGQTEALQDSLCMASVTGRLPAVVADTRVQRTTRRLAWHRPTPIGAFAAVPVHVPNGALFGGLCVAYREPVTDLGPATRPFLATMADVVGVRAQEELKARHQTERERDAVLALFGEGRMSIMLQPIVDLTTGATLGVEALSRFATTPPRPPNLWFAAAARHELGIELEAAAISRAVRLLPGLSSSFYMAVNASPALLASEVIDSLLLEGLTDRLVVEVTEHAAVKDYDHLGARLDRLRARGVRVAVDDAGAGFSSLRHVIKLQPDLIKIDGSLIRDIDAEPLHRAMVESLAVFAHASGATLVAEAVETAAELAILQDLGIPAAQGYLFAAPSPLADLRDQYPVHVPTSFHRPA